MLLFIDLTSLPTLTCPLVVPHVFIEPLTLYHWQGKRAWPYNALTSCLAFSNAIHNAGAVTVVVSSLRMVCYSAAVLWKCISVPDSATAPLHQLSQSTKVGNIETPQRKLASMHDCLNGLLQQQELSSQNLNNPSQANKFRMSDVRCNPTHSADTPCKACHQMSNKIEQICQIFSAHMIS